ncbi:MAG TPA: CotH kinase family protein, partial [Candidatus Eisenbacteria bacterium]|nr:CotH kinase family protein [Candidatus Eisenbacteria bacterium]
VTASPESGFFEQPVRVALATAAAGAVIRYTLDGSIPTQRSAAYRVPLLVDRPLVLRFRSFTHGAPPGPTTTRTYVVGRDFRLPTVSMAIDPVLLWNKYSGIYANPEKRGRKWRRPAHVEYFADRSAPPIRFPAEVNIHGNWSRLVEPKKSFQLTYQPAELSGGSVGRVLVAGSEQTRRAVILRACAMDLGYRLGEELFRAVYAEAGGFVSPALRVMLLLNGEAWGVYNLHQKIDRTYLQDRFGPGEYEMISQEREARPVVGGGELWNELLRFFVAADFRDDRSLREAERRIDLDNFTRHQLFNIYAANLDWPHNNDYAFRRIDGADPRWRWISWDADATFHAERGLEHNTLAWATRDRLRHDLSYAGRMSDAEEFLRSTLILRKLLENPGYRREFIARLDALMDTVFRPDALRARFDRIVAELEPVLGVDWQRWPKSREEFAEGVESVREFIAKRPAIVRRQLVDFAPLRDRAA